MAKRIFLTLLLLPMISAFAAPAFSGQAMGELQSASSVGARAFDGSKVYSGQPGFSLKAAEPTLPEQVVTATAEKSTGKKIWQGVKKAAPYAFAAGVGLWMGIAVAGSFGLPAIAFAAIIVMLFIAGK